MQSISRWREDAIMWWILSSGRIRALPPERQPKPVPRTSRGHKNHDCSAVLARMTKIFHSATVRRATVCSCHYPWACQRYLARGSYGEQHVLQVQESFLGLGLVDAGHPASGGMRLGTSVPSIHGRRTAPDRNGRVRLGRPFVHKLWYPTSSMEGRTISPRGQNSWKAHSCPSRPSIPSTSSCPAGIL